MLPSIIIGPPGRESIPEASEANVALTLHTGPFQPVLEERFLETLRALRARDAFAPITILSPNFQLTRHLRWLAVERLGGLFNVHSSTLQHFLMDNLEPVLVAQGRRHLPASLVPWALKGAAGERLGGHELFGPLLETPGFYRALAAVLSECRQGAFDAAALRRAKEVHPKAAWTRKTDALADALEAYEAWKGREGWFDGDDLLAEALRLERGFPEAGVVLFYGFYDATFSQEAVLRRLEGERSSWFVPYLPTPAFEYAEPFVRRLAARGAVWEREKAAKAGPFPSCLPEILFAAPPERPILEGSESREAFDASPLKVFLCPGERREAREIARALRREASRLDLDYARCAVLSRSPGETRAALLGEMEAQGLPYESRIGLSLDRTPQGKAFSRLCDALFLDFGRSAVMDLLSSPCLDSASFLPGGKGWCPERWDSLSKEARVVSGRAQWRRRVGRWMDLERGREGGEAAVEDAGRLLQVLEVLGTTAVRIEKKADWGESLSLLEGFVRRHFLPSPERDRLADLLGASAYVSGLSRGLDRGDFLQVLQSLVGEETMMAGANLPGGVQVLDLMQTRGVPHDLVVVPGLVEGSVPRPPRPDPFLLDEEREALNAASGATGARLALKRDGSREERLLFTLAVSSARKALVLTAPVLDPQKGIPRVPSLYLHETLAALVGSRPTRLEDLAGWVRSIAIGDWALEDPFQAADPLETALSVTALARRGDMAPALGFLRRHPLAQGGFRAIAAREGGRRFTEYEGVLSEGTARSMEATLSPSRVECYARCPQRYLYRYGLGLTVLPEPEEALAAEPMDLGNLAHHVLERTVARGLAEGWLPSRDATRAFSALEEEAASSLAVFESQDVTGAPCLWAWQKATLLEDLRLALKKILSDRDWMPAAVERSLEEAGRLDAGEGLTLELKGRVDRYDVSVDGRSFRVVDYKTGSCVGYAADKWRGGQRIQLGLYLWAGKALFPGKAPHSGVYAFLTSRGEHKEVPMGRGDWAETERVLRLFLRESREGIRRGLFPPAPDKDCAGCEYWTLCGVGMARRAERKGSAPVLEGLRRMREIP